MPRDFPPYETKLAQGKVPKGQPCPWSTKCPFANDCPAVSKKGTKQDYECDIALFFDLYVDKKEYEKQQYILLERKKKEN